VCELAREASSAQIWRAKGGTAASAMLQKEGYELSIVVPLRVAGDHVGALLLLGLPDDQHLAAEMALLDALSITVALVLRNATFYEEQEHVIAQRTAEVVQANVAQQRSLAELSIRNRLTEIFLTHPGDEMYGEVLKVVLDALQSKYGIFGYIDEDGACVCPSMTSEIWDQCAVPDKTVVFPRESWGGIWGRALTQKRLMCSKGPFDVPAGHIPVTRALDVPIVFEEEVIGHFLVANKEEDYDEEDARLAQHLADRVAPILHARLQRERAERAGAQAQRELERTAEKLTTAASEWRATFDAMPDSVALLDGADIVLRCNTATAVLTGRALEDIVGRHCYEVFHCSEAPHPDCPQQRSRESLQSERAVLEQEGRWLRVEFQPQLDGQGAYAGGVHVVSDITELKQTERQLQASLGRLESVTEEVIAAIGGIVEVRDPYTAGHQRRVSELAAAIAVELGLDDETVTGLRMAALLHDVGKIVAPAEILTKPGRLTDIEYRIIQGHPEAAYNVLHGIQFAWPVAELALQHHERLDGSGYPQGLRGQEIVLGARILAVADVVEAMASHRPYRPALGIAAALEEIEAHRGTLYDAEVADACVTLVREKGFEFEA
jgi:PAS domain S-box-containing protein